MRLALLISLLVLPAIAQAAPVVFAVALYAAQEYIIVQIAILIVAAAYGDAQKRRQARQARDEYNAGLQDRSVTVASTDAPYRYVYGRARVGSNIVAIFTSGDKDEFKHLVCVHAPHECDAFEEIYIKGVALGTLDADGYVTAGAYYSTSTDWFSADFTTTTYNLPFVPADGTKITVVYPEGAEGPTTVAYTYDAESNSITVDSSWDGFTLQIGFWHVVEHPRVRVQKHLGTAGDPVDAYLHGLLPTEWPATATLDDCCYTVITLDLNQPEFQPGIPPVEVLLRGKKLYDPRTELTAWSQNPALVIYDYLTSELCGVDAADIPQASLIAAANACDEVVSMASIDSSGTQQDGPRYTINGAVTSDQPQQDVLEKMAQAMAGGIVSTTWEMWAGTYVAPVMALYVDRPGDMGDVVGQISITPGVSAADLYNGVKGQYVSSDNSYVATDFEPYQNSSYVTADGGEKWTDIDFPFTDNKQRVWNLSRIFTEDQRNGYTVRAQFSRKAWAVKVGQRITLTSTVFGWSDKVFRVTERQFSPTSPVELTLKEDASSIWDFVDEAQPDATPNTNLPNPFAIDPLASLTCTSGNDTLAALQDGTVIARIKAAWPEATTQAVFTNGLIEVEWQRIGSNTWQKVTASGSDTETFLSPIEEQRAYVVRARAVNPYLNVKSDWIYTNHLAAGKSEAPPDVTGFAVSVLSDATRRFSWTTSDQPADVLHGGGYRIKYRTAGTSTAWADMTAVHSGLITQSPFDTRTPAAGTYDFAISAVDGSGNESANAALVEDVVVSDTSTASTALANAATAQAAADAAQADADTANADLANIADDDVLSKGEKPKLIADVNALLDEFVKNRLQADAFSVSRTDYDTAIWRLYDYLGTLAPSYDNLAADTAIDGPLLRQKFASAYLARQIMLNAIATKASTLATWTGVVSSSGKLSTAGDIFNDGSVGTVHIAPNAATDIYLATFAGPTDLASDVCSISFTPDVDSDLVITAISDFTADNISGGTDAWYRILYWIDVNGDEVNDTEQSSKVQSSSTYKSSLMTEYRTTASAGVTQTITTSFTNGAVSSPYVMVDFSNIRLKVEIIKR